MVNNSTGKLLAFAACSLLTLSSDLCASGGGSPDFSDSGEGYESAKVIDREDRAGKFGPQYKHTFRGDEDSSVSSEDSDTTMDRGAKRSAPEGKNAKKKSSKSEKARNKRKRRHARRRHNRRSDDSYRTDSDSSREY